MAKREESALDRLQRLSEPSEEREFTLEEQMDSVSTDDFLDGMSVAAKDQMSHLFEEVTMDDEDPIEEPQIIYAQPVNVAPQPMPRQPEAAPVAPQAIVNNEELFNNNMKPKRKYTKRNAEDTTPADSSNKLDYSSNPVLDQLAKDVIDDLRTNCHKINRFDDKSMAMIFDYMYSKF